VIPLYLAKALRGAGLFWTPARGDRFVVGDRDMDEQVFVVSDMTVEVHKLPLGTVIGFNGTVEWALDDVELDEAVWLPREDQLRDRLGTAFARLERDAGRWLVTSNGKTFSGADPEEAYGRALLDLLTARVP
jgi:hypothetical protein